jgi:hypothetical protein
MSKWHKSLKEVETNAAHYIALGELEIYLDEDDPDLPWQDVSHIVAGGGYRLNGPTGFYCIAERNGLTLKWSIDFECRDANGKGHSLFDRDRLRMTMQKLPPKARKALASFLEQEVLPGVEKTTAEWREYLNKQLDSEDCVRGLIAFARS